jgi:hypothetical protein
MKTEIISFYCDIDGSTYYSDNASRIINECVDLKIPFDFRKINSHGDYRLNCLRKPKFILSVLEEKKKPIVWLDIDSKLHKTLDVFDKFAEMNVDLGFAYYETQKEKINVLQPKASPIFCNYNEKVINFLKTWLNKCEETLKSEERFFDHEILMFRVLPFFVNQLKIGCLPLAYCVWPGRCPVEIDPYITMGIADGKSKEKNIRELAKKIGMNEDGILLNLNRI